MTADMNTDSPLTERFPVLSRLSLTADEWQALSRQGFVSSEQRGRKTVYRLRFRLHGRQYVRYLPLRDVTTVRQELDKLQKDVRARRRIKSLTPLAWAALRSQRSLFTPVLETKGYHFHGHSIRRRRSTQS